MNDEKLRWELVKALDKDEVAYLVHLLGLLEFATHDPWTDASPFQKELLHEVRLGVELLLSKVRQRQSPSVGQVPTPLLSRECGFRGVG